MSNAPVCHISVNQGVVTQPRATLLPSVGVAVDLPSAITVINQLKLLIQMLAGQQPVTGPAGVNGFAGPVGSAGSAGAAGPPGKDGQKGKDAKSGGRFQEDRGQRIKETIRVFQDNDKESDNWVDIEQINKVVWVDSVTGETIVWSR